MFKILIPDIGDGLAASFRFHNGIKCQIDCGSTNNSKIAYNKSMLMTDPFIFILSHYHLDHYNGLFEANNNYHRIKQVYLPLLPISYLIDEFILCLLAMNHYVVGDKTGSKEIDFLNILRKKNACDFDYSFKSEGDNIIIGNHNAVVLWPPKYLSNAISKTVSTAINDFHIAIQSDCMLNKIYNRIKEDHNTAIYTKRKDSSCDRNPNTELDVDIETDRIPLNADIKTANNSLRKVANSLSLAFRIDDTL